MLCPLNDNYLDPIVVDLARAYACLHKGFMPDTALDANLFRRYRPLPLKQTILHHTRLISNQPFPILSRQFSIPRSTCESPSTVTCSRKDPRVILAASLCQRQSRRPPGINSRRVDRSFVFENDGHSKVQRVNSSGGSGDRPLRITSDKDVEASFIGEDENQGLEAGVIPESRLLAEDPTNSSGRASTSGRHSYGTTAGSLLYPPAQRSHIRESWWVPNQPITCQGYAISCAVSLRRSS